MQVVLNLNNELLAKLLEKSRREGVEVDALILRLIEDCDIEPSPLLPSNIDQLVERMLVHEVTLYEAVSVQTLFEQAVGGRWDNVHPNSRKSIGRIFSNLAQKFGWKRDGLTTSGHSLYVKEGAAHAQ